MKTNMNVDFPLDDSWSTDDIVAVSGLYNLVLGANEGPVNRAKLLQAYADFKRVVPSKGEQRQLDRELERQTGFSIYQTMKAANATDKVRFEMHQGR